MAEKYSLINHRISLHLPKLVDDYAVLQSGKHVSHNAMGNNEITEMCSYIHNLTELSLFNLLDPLANFSFCLLVTNCFGFFHFGFCKTFHKVVNKFYRNMTETCFTEVCVQKVFIICNYDYPLCNAYSKFWGSKWPVCYKHWYQSSPFQCTHFPVTFDNHQKFL